jgi:condensin-2 complex subunit G2
VSPNLKKMSETQEPEAEGSKHTKAVIKALLSAVEDVDESSEHAFSCKALIRLFHPSKRIDFIVNGISPKQQQSLILETIQSLPKGPVKRLFSGLKSILETILSEEAYVPESAFQEDDEDAEIMGDEKSTKCLHFMKYAAMCSEAFLEGQIAHTKRKSVGMQLQILPQVYDVAADLHNALLSVHDCGPESLGTETAIISLCESWWLANAMHRDTLIAQCLPLLVVQALDGQEFQKSQIKKLYKLKDAFQVVDFTNPSSDSLRSLLLRVASNPLCLRMPEGKKFLASLFQDPDLVTDLHLAFRAQIPDAKKTILQAYGEIYRKAWKQAADAAPEVRDAIEHQALQDLMHAAIHVSSPAMAKFILTVLEPVHADKKSPQVAGLLYRLYSPILWRSLAAANPLVRKNAVTVLEQVYPLQDPSQTQMKEAVSKGTAALKSALQDVDPRVRVAGSEATARICAMFWDALPAADIRMLLNRKYS